MPWLDTSAAIAADTSSSAAATTAVVGAAAAPLAVFSNEPMPAASAAADASISGTASTYDINASGLGSSAPW